MKKNKPEVVEELANLLCEKIGNVDNEIAKKVYMKAFWHLPQVSVWGCVETAMRYGKNPAKLLTYLLKKELNNL